MTSPSNLELAYYVTIALTGLVGNTTTIIVFSQRRLRSLRSSFFLTCLAITDLVFILIIIVALLDGLQVPVMTIPTCMLTIYLSHIASFLSSNFTLAYTSHRLIAVFFPIKATTFLKQRTNRFLAFGLFFFACSFYSLSFPVVKTTLRSNTSNVVYCEEDSDKGLLFPFLVLDTLFTFIIPFSLISCMNLAIVYKLHSKFTYTVKTPLSTASQTINCPSGKSSTNSSGQFTPEGIPLPTMGSSSLKTSNSHSTSNNSTTTNSNGHSTKKLLIKSENNQLIPRPQDRSFLCVRPANRYKQRRVHRSTNSSQSPSPQRHIPLYQGNTSIRIRSTQCRTTASAKTTKMLLAASTVFLVFNLPYHLLLFCFLFMKTQPTWMLRALNIARLWFFASFCVNFFVYAICGQRFRHEVVRLFSCTFFRRYFSARPPKSLHDRQNSMYLSHRLLPMASTNLSHTN